MGLRVDCVSGLTLPFRVACEHVLPVLLAELAEGETLHRPAVESIVTTRKLLLPREIDTLEFVEERDVSQVSILATTDQVSGPLHLWVVQAAIETNHVGCFGMTASLPE